MLWLHGEEGRDPEAPFLDRLAALCARDLREVILVGASLGGWIAAEMAVKCADRLAGLVLVAPLGIEVGDRETRDIPDIFALHPRSDGPSSPATARPPRSTPGSRTSTIRSCGDGSGASPSPRSCCGAPTTGSCRRDTTARLSGGHPPRPPRDDRAGRPLPPPRGAGCAGRAHRPVPRRAEGPDMRAWFFSENAYHLLPDAREHNSIRVQLPNRKRRRQAGRRGYVVACFLTGWGGTQAVFGSYRAAASSSPATRIPSTARSRRCTTTSAASGIC